MKTIKMIKSIAVAMLFMLAIQQSFAAGISFQKNKTWKELLALAKKENKILFIDAYVTWCGPCKYLQGDVFTQGDVGAYFNTSFINGAINMEEGEGPEFAKKFDVTAYPTLFFFDGDGKLLHKKVGAIDGTELIALGKEAIDPSTQYYTLKAKAIAGKLLPEAMGKWAQAAQDIEDADADKIVDDYINTPTRNWLNKHVLNLVFEYSGVLSDEKMAFLIKNKAEIKKLLEWMDDDFNRAFKRKAVLIAIENISKADKMDYNAFKATLKKFIPQDAELETRKMKVKYSFVTNKDEEGMAELLSLIDDAATFNFDIVDISNLIIDYAENIGYSKKANELVDKLSALKLLPKDTGKDYYKYFSIMIITYYGEDASIAKQYAQKVIAASNTPQNLVSMANKVLAGE